MKLFVVDAKTVVKLFVPEVHSAAARRLMRPDIALYAPDFLVTELGNVMWKKVRRGEIQLQEALERIGGVDAIGIQLGTSVDLVPPALKLSTALDHPVYDCLYLALAIAQHCPVVTADARFAAAVTKTPFAKHIRWIEDEL